MDAGCEPSLLAALPQDDPEACLDVLRRDVIGADACVEGPFGPRRIAYADHIASGRSLASVEDAIRRVVLPTYANTHTEDSATGARTTALARWAAAYIKRCLGADDRYAVSFPGTGATGTVKRLQEILGVAVPSTLRDRVLEVLPPEERWVVFVGPYEHHSNEVSWRESLAEVVTVPMNASGVLDVHALEERVSDPRYEGRPKLGSFSAASNVTGLRTDVRAVARILRRHGARVAFDFAASGPYLDIDMRPGRADAIDAVMLSPHKFLGGPGSPGLLAFHRDLYRLAAPTTAGGGTVSYVNDREHAFVDDVEAREDAGTPGIVQRIRAALAFGVKERVGTATIHAREVDFAARALARLGAHPRIELLGNVGAPRLAVASFLVRSGPPAPDGRPAPYLHPRFVIRLLSDLFGIQGRAGCSCAGPYGHTLLSIDASRSAAYRAAVDAGYEGIKPGWSRVSFHWLLDEGAFAYLLEALDFVGDHGARFLPLYAFDWKGGAWRYRGGPGMPAPTADDGHDAWAEPRRSSRPVADDRRRYLQEAHALAARLDPPSSGSSGRGDVPAGVDPALVTFAH
ncbi:MAG: aminotransferase class V-fold PLP-dependent enzyme [Trueperaceae bacterium]|nr:aminotransferase class V-fold PLP-dependent enzyme [Trueperaceae bacterium]